MSDWCCAAVECRMCGGRHVSVYPADIVDECSQECPDCGHMTCEPTEDVIEGPLDISGWPDPKGTDGTFR